MASKELNLKEIFSYAMSYKIYDEFAEIFLSKYSDLDKKAELILPKIALFKQLASFLNLKERYFCLLSFKDDFIFSAFFDKEKILYCKTYKSSIKDSYILELCREYKSEILLVENAKDEDIKELNKISELKFKELDKNVDEKLLKFVKPEQSLNYSRLFTRSSTKFLKICVLSFLISFFIGIIYPYVYGFFDEKIDKDFLENKIESNKININKKDELVKELESYFDTTVSLIHLKEVFDLLDKYKIKLKSFSIDKKILILELYDEQDEFMQEFYNNNFFLLKNKEKNDSIKLFLELKDG